MSKTLTEDELNAWRSKRTGRPVKSDDNGPAVPTNAGGGPDVPRSIRSPVDGMPGVPALNIDDEPAPQDTPTFNLPAHDADEELRQQLAAANGRLGPVQRQLEEMRAAHEATQRQLAEYQAQLAEHQAAQATAKAQKMAAEFDPFEGMSAAEIEMLDPAAAELIKRAARNAYSKAASSVKDPEALINDALAKRDARSRDNYIRATAETLGLVKLGSDQKFNRFLTEDDSAGILLNSFVKAPDLETARALEPRVRTMLKRYEKAATPTRNPDPQDQLSQHLDRGHGGASANRKGATTPEEARQIRGEIARLTRARKFKEAETLQALLNN
jgi:hypothetical protein